MEKSPAGRNHQLAGITSWQFTSWQMIHHLIAVTSWQFPVWVTSWQESQSDMSHQLVGVTIWPDSPAGMSHQLTRVTSWYESPSGRNHQLVWVNIWQESPAGMNTIWQESPAGMSHHLAGVTSWPGVTIGWHYQQSWWFILMHCMIVWYFSISWFGKKRCRDKVIVGYLSYFWSEFVCVTVSCCLPVLYNGSLISGTPSCRVHTIIDCPQWNHDSSCCNGRLYSMGMLEINGHVTLHVDKLGHVIYVLRATYLVTVILNYPVMCG